MMTDDEWRQRLLLAHEPRHPLEWTLHYLSLLQRRFCRLDLQCVDRLASSELGLDAFAAAWP